MNARQAERDKYIEEYPDFLNDYPVSYEHRELFRMNYTESYSAESERMRHGEKAEKKE